MATRKKSPKPQGITYTPEIEAQESVSRAVSGWGGKNIFMNVSDLAPNVKHYFRALPPDAATQELHGKIEFLPVKKYGIKDYRLNDENKPKFCYHVSEKALGEPVDQVYEYLKDKLDDLPGMYEEEGGDSDDIQIYRDLFIFSKNERDDGKGSKIRHTNRAGNDERWLPVIPIVDVEDGKSIPDPSGAKIININWSCQSGIFGGGKKKGLVGDTEVGYTLYNQYKGVDFYIERVPKGGKSTASDYFVGTRRSDFQTDIEDSELWTEDKLPKLLDEAKKGIKTEEALHILKVHFGDEEPKEDEENKPEPKETKRSTGRKRKTADI